MKKVDTKAMSNDERDDAEKEIKTHKKLSHPNIVKMYDNYKTTDHKLIMIMEWAEKLDLNHEIARRSKRGENYFSEAEIIQFTAQICLGLKYVHDR